MHTRPYATVLDRLREAGPAGPLATPRPGTEIERVDLVIRIRSR